MKGFGGILILFTVLIVSIILLSSTQPIKNEENNTNLILKIKNFVTIYEFNLKNMSYDCNWQKPPATIQNCLQTGTNLIFENANLDLLLSCVNTPVQITSPNTYFTTLACTNKTILWKNTNFTIQKTVLLTNPNP